MTIQPVLIDGAWQEVLDPVGSFSATNPATGERLEGRYPISGARDLDRALAAARRAAAELRALSPDALAAFLEAYAARLEEEREALVRIAALETGLPPEPRLRSVELPRTTAQLRQAAAACRDRSWCRATLDTRNNLRSWHAPLGPVAVLGPGNFPFAFNAAAGGDFAAALAAGNPVLAKAHPGHPGTTRALAALAFAVLEAQRLPRAALQLLYHLEPEQGLRLVAHPLVGATAFTGSRAAGLRLKRAADEAGKPIYLELSSANPVVLLPGALEERGETIAQGSSPPAPSARASSAPSRASSCCARGRRPRRSCAPRASSSRGPRPGSSSARTPSRGCATSSPRWRGWARRC
jgi:NADP-dependent aldehyde dehydrogenase